MYDPNVNYQPPVKYDGTPLTHTIGIGHRRRRQSDIFANVQSDPFTAPAATHVNLTAKVAVPLYCNTDWPITKGGPTSSLTIADVGDANGENSPPVAGVGDWCRINGTKYDGIGRLHRAGRHVCERKPAVRLPVQELERRHRRAVLLPAAREQDPLLRQDLAVLAQGAGRDHRLHAGGHADLRRAAVHARHHQADLQPEHASQDVQPDDRAPQLYAGGVQDAARRSTASRVSAGPTATLRARAPRRNACRARATPTISPPAPRSAASSATRARPCAARRAATRPSVPTSRRRRPRTAAARASRSTTTAPPAARRAPRSCGTRSPTSRRRRRPPSRTRTRRATPAATTTRSTRSAALRRPAGCSPTRGPASATSTPRTRPASRRTRRRAPSPPRRRAAARRSARRSHIPRHYYTIDSIQFCDNIDITVNGQWRGFGAGVCKPANDLTQFQNVKYGQFHRDRPAGGRRPQLPLHRPGHAAAVDAHVRAGDHQLRELVRLLPASRARREDDVLARVQPAGRHLPRRLPHARSGAAADRTQPRDQRPRLGRRRRFHAGRREPEEPVVERAVRGPDRDQRQDAVAVRDAADRQPVRDGRCRRAPGDRLPAARGREGSAQGFVRQRRELPEQLSHRVHRRVHEPDRAPGGRRRAGQRDARSVAGAGAHRRTASAESRQRAAGPSQRRRVATAIQMGHEARSGHAGRRRDVLLGARPPARGQGRRAVLVGQDAERHRPDEGRRLVAARAVLGAVVRLGRHARRREPAGDSRQHRRAAQRAVAGPHEPEQPAAAGGQQGRRRRSTTCGTRR